MEDGRFVRPKQAGANSKGKQSPGQICGTGRSFCLRPSRKQSFKQSSLLLCSVFPPGVISFPLSPGGLYRFRDEMGHRIIRTTFCFSGIDIFLFSTMWPICGKCGNGGSPVSVSVNSGRFGRAIYRTVLMKVYKSPIKFIRSGWATGRIPWALSSSFSWRSQHENSIREWRSSAEDLRMWWRRSFSVRGALYF